MLGLAQEGPEREAPQEEFDREGPGDSLRALKLLIELARELGYDLRGKGFMKEMRRLRRDLGELKRLYEEWFEPERPVEGRGKRPPRWFRHIFQPKGPDRKLLRKHRRMHRKVQRMERKLFKLARRIRRAKDEEEKKSLRTLLEKRVSELFDKREELRAKVLEYLKKRVEELEQKLKVRKENKQKIIERRVAELLGEDELSW
jgi:hypothetical protein